MTFARPIHVLPHKLGGWSVQREGDAQPLSEHGNATDAERAATYEAAASAPAPEVLVHDRYERLHQAPQPAATRDGPLDVLVAGAGPAALEVALTLHRLAGTHVTTTLLAPDSEFTYRPLSVLAPFAAGATPGYPLARIAADAVIALPRLNGRHIPGLPADTDGFLTISSPGPTAPCSAGCS
jgi:hypothetical protein